MRTIETPRLVLRGWRFGDLESFHRCCQNPNVGPDAGWEPHTSRSASLGILYRFIVNDESWAITLKDSGRQIGSISLTPDRKRGGIEAYNLGYHLAEEHWGHGYAAEAARAVLRHAFEYARVDVVSVNHYPHNHRSRRVIEKCGFVPEGVLRRAFRRYDGVLLDLVCYSMLPEEYMALRDSFAAVALN